MLLRFLGFLLRAFWFLGNCSVFVFFNYRNILLILILFCYCSLKNREFCLFISIIYFLVLWFFFNSCLRASLFHTSLSKNTSLMVVDFFIWILSRNFYLQIDTLTFQIYSSNNFYEISVVEKSESTWKTSSKREGKLVKLGATLSFKMFRSTSLFLIANYQIVVRSVKDLLLAL